MVESVLYDYMYPHKFIIQVHHCDGQLVLPGEGGCLVGHASTDLLFIY